MEYPFLFRLASSAVERALAVSPVTVLTGARQTGKTTLVRNLGELAGTPYLSRGQGPGTGGQGKATAAAGIDF